jgi:serine/threonine protein kinase
MLVDFWWSTKTVGLGSSGLATRVFFMFVSMLKRKPAKMGNFQDRMQSVPEDNSPQSGPGQVGSLEGSGVPSPRYQQASFGASMKFQYGNGDKPLDGYVIKRGVGSGGFGEVYFAESDSGKEVALKRIQKNLEVEVRGVRHCLNLRHPNLVGIYDIRFDKDEQGWIVMEFIGGESLRERIDRYSQVANPEEAIALFAQLAAGVAYLHDQGIVHRDLKPANVFIDNGLVKIGDYGLSKYISASRRGGQTESVGTFHYMAPEIGRGEYGKEIDIYSLGVILYEMLTGFVPFDGESSQEIILKHLTADPDVSMLPEPFASTIQRALAKNASLRFSDCRELLWAIGWDLDASGLAFRKTTSTSMVSPPVLVNQASTNTKKQKRVLGNNDPTVAGASPLHFAANASEPINTFQEPIARAFNSKLIEMQHWFRNLPSSTRGIAIAIMVVTTVFVGNILAPIAFILLCVYACYYVVWYVGGGPEHARRLATASSNSIPVVRNANPVARNAGYAAQAFPVAGYGGTGVAGLQAPAARLAKPISYKAAYRNWQAEQREILSKRGLWTYLHSYTRSWVFSGIVIGVLALAASIMTHARVDENAMSLVSGITWVGVMSLLASWSIIFFGRRWEKQPEDSIVFRFVMMTVGGLLGAISYGLSSHLMIPWNELAHSGWEQLNMDGGVLNPGDWNRSWKGFYEGESPLLAAHIAYFASLMWVVRWWRQSDSLRKSRFSVFSIAWTVALAALVQGFFFFPAPWCLAFAGLTSVAVQMASPWIPYEPSTRTA